MDKIPGGYYIKARKIKHSWISHQPPIVREIWDYLLREANHCEKQYGKYQIVRGQLFKKYSEIIEDLSWKVGYRTMRYSMSSTKRAMKVLSNELMIELTNRPQGTIITILNYDFFQNPENYERTYERTNERITNGPTNGPSISNKNERKVKNVKTSLGRNIFAKPQLDDVIKFFGEKGFDQSHAKKFFEYYSAGDWKDGRGNQVKNWKQKALAVWMNDELKTANQPSRPELEYYDPEKDPTYAIR